MDVRISQLSFAYPGRSFRLRIPGLRVDGGSAAAFVGPSGSGKSTLLRLIAGIQLPDTGEITLGGTSIPGLDDAARRAFRISRIGFVFQDFRLLEHLDVAENIYLPARLHPAARRAGMRERARELATAAGVGARLQAGVEALSHGERQRVAICRALLLEPGLLLADEPTGNLDPESKDRVVDLLLAESRRCRATLIMVTHDRDLLGRFGQVVDFKSYYEP